MSIVTRSLPCSDCGSRHDTSELTEVRGQVAATAPAYFLLCDDCLAALGGEREESTTVPARSVVYGGPGLAVLARTDCTRSAICYADRHHGDCAGGRYDALVYVQADAHVVVYVGPSGPVVA